MIYTVTFNPAIDYVIKVDNLTLGQVNRTTREYIFCGGKGINVSHLLANLGVDSVGLGFIAGFTGDVIESGAKELGYLNHSFFYPFFSYTNICCNIPFFSNCR